MQRTEPIRGASASAMRHRAQRSQPVALVAVVDVGKIPPRCFGEPLCVAAVKRRWARAYDALCRALCRNRQVGITTVDLDGAPRVAALVPIGGLLAVSPLRAEYTAALADGLRGDGRRARASRHASRRSHARA